MRFSDVSAIEAADAAPWPGPRVMRSFSTLAVVRLALAASLLYVLSGVGSLFLVGWDLDAVRHPGAWLMPVLFCFGFPLVLLGGALLLPPYEVRRWGGRVGLVALFCTPLIVTLAVYGTGPGHAAIITIYLQAPVFAFYMIRRRWAVATAVSALAGFGLVVWLQDGWGLGIWVWAAASISGASVVIGLIAARADELAASEHEARVALDDLNHTLEDRVETQVSEIDHLSGLRRFLSPQIADAVVSGRVAEIGAPHRRRIAVFFCDLRGFTAFTNAAEPEEVIAVLDAYYRTVGVLLQRYDATVGDYAGDGIMAYFGDPVPREDAAAVSVEMTIDVVRAMRPVAAEWRRCGYDLDFGIGLAHGYATLGVVGFDGRYDYKPVGGVVNLAARLCARAGPGQVLMDHASYAATSDVFPSDPVADLDLKGYGGRVHAYALRID